MLLENYNFGNIYDNCYLQTCIVNTRPVEIESEEAIKLFKKFKSIYPKKNVYDSAVQAIFRNKTDKLDIYAKKLSI